MSPGGNDRLQIDPRLLQSLKGIELKSRFLVRGLYNNRHRTSDFGASNEFIEHRDYQPGDEIRTIDWRVYARTDRLYVKRFEMEANMRIHGVLDTSSSMQVPAPQGLPTKLELASIITGSVAMMGISQQDAVGLTTIGDRIEERIPPRQGQRHLAQLYQHLGKPRGSGGGRFGEVLRDSLHEFGTRGLVFVITDALDDLEPLFDALKGFLVREQDVTLFQVLDRDEVLFPFDRMTEFRHPETGRRIMGDPTVLRSRYLGRLQQHLDQMDGFCKKNRVDYLRLHNGEDLMKLLSSHFLQRLTMERTAGRSLRRG